MGKKSAQQVATAVSVTPPTKSAKKGNKRDAVGALEKRVSAKKQKLVEQELLKKQNSAAKTKKKQKNTSLEDASESEEEEPVLTAIKLPAVVAKNGSAVVVSKKKDETSEGSDSDSGSDEDDDETEAMVKKLPVAKATNGTAVVSKKNLAKVIPQVNKFPAAVVSKKKDETSDGTESDEEDGDEESAEDSSDDEPSKVQQVKKPAKASMESSGSEEGSFEEESEEEEKPAKTPKKNQSIKASKESSGSEDPSSEEESEEEQPAKTPKNNAKTPATPNVETTGTKTLFAGNLSFSIEKTDVEEFFKDVGEIVDVRFASKDGQFKGFGHIEFATEAAAKKALELNGEDLLGRPVKLDLSRERGSYTPHSSKEGNSNQKGGNGQARTLFVRGFDTSAGEDEIRRTLEEHFGSCGEISRMSVPKDYDTGAPKGFAYIDFQNDDSFSKALELNGSELGEYSLVLEEARPRTDNRDGGGSGRGSGGRRGGGRFSGRRGGGRDGGGRFGGRDGGGRFGGGRFGGRDGGGRGGRFGGGGRGRGSGRKTNFDD